MSEQIPVRDGDALLIVDLQNDFLPGGRLGVAGGDEVVAPLARCIDVFHQHGQPIYATRDWHPADLARSRLRAGHGRRIACRARPARSSRPDSACRRSP